MELITGIAIQSTLVNPTYNALLRGINGRPLSLDTIRGYWNERLTAIRPATAQTLRSALKALALSYAPDIRQRAAVETFFKAEIKAPRPDKKIYNEKTIQADDYTRVTAAVSPKMALVIEALNITGLRVSELAGIKLTDIEPGENCVYIRVVGKRKKERRVFIRAELFNRVRQVFNGRVYLFETASGRPLSRQHIWRAIRRGGKRIGLNKLHPHTFRHTFATRLIKRGRDLKAVSQYLGHASPTTTAALYCHTELTPDDVFTVNG